MLAGLLTVCCFDANRLRIRRISPRPYF